MEINEWVYVYESQYVVTPFMANDKLLNNGVWVEVR